MSWDFRVLGMSEGCAWGSCGGNDDGSVYTFGAGKMLGGGVVVWVEAVDAGCEWGVCMVVTGFLSG